MLICAYSHVHEPTRPPHRHPQYPRPGDAHRHLEFLRDGERCVCEIFPAIGHEQSNVSRHLNLMQTAGLLTRRKEGPKIFYAVRTPEVLELLDLAGIIAGKNGG